MAWRDPAVVIHGGIKWTSLLSYILQNMSINALQVAKQQKPHNISLSSFVCAKSHQSQNNETQNVFLTLKFESIFLRFPLIHAFPIRTALHEPRNEWMNERMKEKHCVMSECLPCEWMPWIWCANTINTKIIIFSNLSIVLKRPIIGRSSWFPRRFLLLLFRWPLCRSSNFTFFISLAVCVS